MAGSSRDAQLTHYQRELGYLRRMGQAFADTYPKIAARLDIGGSESPDPHVERLIESFAFLTGRIQQNIDAEFPQIPQALLGILYPQFTQPIPSISIAQFNVDSLRGKLTDGYELPKGSEVFATAPNGMTCRFRSVYPVTLWPIEIDEAAIESTDRYDFLDDRVDVHSVLRLRIRTQADALSTLGMDSLRLHLHGDKVVSDALYELLFVNAKGVALIADGRRDAPTILPGNPIRQVGFERDEAVIPVPDHGQPAYHLLREYFTFPEKFLYFDIDGLSKARAEKTLDILILLQGAPPRSLSVEPDMFRPFTTPIVNLFRKTSEPIRIDGRQPEYRLVGDRRRETVTEIHSIVSVTASNQEQADSFRVEPFFSFNHEAKGRDAQAFWFARRDATARADLKGTDVYLSFVDLDYRPTQPATTTLFAHTLCTNRGLAEQLRAGAELQTEVSAPVSGISVLYKPTAQVEPPVGGETLWRLISHLSLNYLSLSQFDGSLQALREILRLYANDAAPGTEQQINGLVGMDCRRAVARMGQDVWRGFARGVDVELTVDERAFVGSSAILLASVLDRFLSLYASVNAFSRLTVKSQQRDGEWKRWPPRAGDQVLL
ncbi:type VI secretion system baseplate subunit TssF [Rhodospirillaceae bacterium KN72]|uniref:Type VI secretion system baseplate subunit TssF n=1 Tax=Pacificispira spongiicola TaxID=2729598 RepID=A0A7Y0DZC9_9PROT|nr:type VI secretion system baseplate subunit TssF [Pacificispira spongiicola]NMM44351.1 type VI secretion system baseplate subunit TssF [Pacificispira spongiicola]